MNCEVCKSAFDLKNKTPYILNCCQGHVCKECCKGNLNNMKKCPLCKVN